MRLGAPIAHENLNLPPAGGPVREDALEVPREQTQEPRDQWADAARRMPEFEENLDAAQNTLEDRGTPDLLQALDESGLGDHPEMIRALARIGRGGPAQSRDLRDPATQAQIMYSKKDKE